MRYHSRTSPTALATVMGVDVTNNPMAARAASRSAAVRSWRPFVVESLIWLAGCVCDADAFELIRFCMVLRSAKRFTMSACACVCAVAGNVVGLPDTDPHGTLTL